MMRLQAALKRLEQTGLLQRKQGRFDSVLVDRLTSDSRKVTANTLFVAIRGKTADGHLFIDKAVQNGATAIVCEAMPENARERFPGMAFVQVSQSRAALAELAAEFYGDPSRSLRMVGVTGTNGKTTTTFLLHHALQTVGLKTGLIGTIRIDVGGGPMEPTHTTPDAVELQGLLRQMVDNGCTACAMEVSSHALDQDRARAVDFDAAVFTNLTRDHMDYHGSFDHYRAAKKKLFDGLSAEAAALYNADDPAGAYMVEHTQARRVSYGQSPEADLRVEVLENGVRGLRLRLDGAERTCRLVGSFNAYNLAAAYGAGLALGAPRTALLDALALAPPPPGRFEQISFSDGTTVIVDYAHTPDALDNVLQTLRQMKPPGAALWCIFGCGGDRDRSKRRIMGSIAEREADQVVVTSDNPRTEDPETIMDEIRRGMDRPAQAAWIVDRKEALQWAAEHVRPGDVVLVAGKGHEPYQIVGAKKRPFDDRAVVRQLFSMKHEG